VKITKSQLKQIIKEELGEARYDDSDAQDWADQSGQKLYADLTDDQKAALAALEVAVNNAYNAGLTDADIRDTIESITMS